MAHFTHGCASCTRNLVDKPKLRRPLNEPLDQTSYLIGSEVQCGVTHSQFDHAG